MSAYNNYCTVILPHIVWQDESNGVSDCATFLPCALSSAVFTFKVVKWEECLTDFFFTELLAH